MGCCHRGEPPPDWLIGVVAAVLVVFFIWFAILVVQALFSPGKVESMPIKATRSGWMWR